MLIVPGKDPRGDAELVEAIRGEIAASAEGAIPFARFMHLCLQHPTRGYYRRGRSRAGHGGDFLTSPEGHPAFSGTMARQLEICGEVLGVERPTFVEAGAGTGTMANLVAQALGSNARVIALDSAAHAHPPEEGAARPARVRADALPFGTGTIEGGIYANELFDAFPVHRLVRAGETWREMTVGAGERGFEWQERVAAPELARAADAVVARGARVREGQRVEVAPAIGPWLREAARVLSRGFVLLADYGEDTARLFGDTRPEGSLRCFAGHAVHDDPLRYVGTQDITAHVDFGAVAAAAREAGFEAVAFITQREWLDGWGVGDAAAGISALADAEKIRRDEVETNVNALSWLRDPRGLGGVKILALAKGLRPQPVPGLTGEVPEARRFRAADLPLTRLFDPFADILE